MTAYLKKYIKRYSYKKLLLPGCISVFVFLLALPAHAQVEGTMASLATILFYILNIVINTMAGLAGAMDVIFSVGVTTENGDTIPVVRDTWVLVRDFSNMFFIIGLIVMAFATIFDVSKYNFRAMIVRFLIVALLINFSLVIGQTIIDWTQSLSSVFLTAMGSYSNLLGGELDPTQLLGEPGGVLGKLRPFLYRLGGTTGAIGVWTSFATDSNIYAQITQMFFSIILGSIIAFSLLVGVIFTAIRIPILWMLLIMAPAAWVSSIFPPLAEMNRKWWRYFLAWNFFLPIYLFFLYIGMYFLQNQDAILSSADTSTALAGIGFSFQTLFFYAFVGLFMIYGVKASMSMGITAGAGGVAGAIWAKGAANARFARGSLARTAFKATPLEDVRKDAAKTFREQGFAGFEATEKNLGKLYQGQQGRDKAASWLGAKTGLAPGLAEKQTQRNIQAAEQKFKDGKKYDEDALIKVLGNGTLEEKIAAANRLKDLNYNLKGYEIAPIFEEYKKVSPSEAVRWIRGQNIDSLDRDGLKALEDIGDPQLNQKIARIKAKRNLIPDKDSYVTALSRFSNNEGDMVGMLGDSKEFIDGLDKKGAEEILDAIPDTFFEAKKKFAMQVAEKGFLTDKLATLVGTGDKDSKEPGAHGIFASSTEVEKLLDLAKKANPLEALTLKETKGLLRDAYERDAEGKPTVLKGTDGIAKALKQEFDKLDVEGMAKIKSDEAKQTGFYNSTVLDAFKKSLNENRNSEAKIKSMYLDPKFVNNSPLAASVDGALQEVRINSFRKDKVKPFMDSAYEALNTLLPAIEASKATGDSGALSIALQKAKISKERTNELSKEILKSPIATTEIKQDVEGFIVDINRRYDELTKKRGTEGPKKTSDQTNAQKQKQQESAPTPKILQTPGGQFESNLSEEERRRRGY